MARRIVFMIAAALVPLALVLQVGVANARPDVVGVGIKKCMGAWTGTLSFVPPLRTGGTATPETVYLNAKARPCFGGSPPAYGTIFGRGVTTTPGANDCSQIFPLSPPGGFFVMSFAPPFAEKVSWTPGVVSPTNIGFPSMKVKTPALVTGRIKFSSAGGTAVGSFPTLAASQSINTVKTYAVITGNGPGDCGSLGGVAALAISAVGTKGTF